MKYEDDIRIVSNSTMNELYDYIDKYPNTTQYVLVLCYDKFTIGSFDVPCRSSYLDTELNFYTIMYNYTNSPNGFMQPIYKPWPTDDKLTHLKTMVDNAYLSYYSMIRNITTPVIGNKLQAYPSTVSRFAQNANVISILGVFYLYLPSMIIFTILLGDLVKEKENNLKIYLNLYGLSYPGYWCSWILTAIVISMILSLEIVIVGRYFFKYEIFTNTNMLVSFGLFLLFSLNMQVLAMLLSCIVTDSKSATTVLLINIDFICYYISWISPAVLLHESFIDIHYIC
jgi:hypothetical protein